MNVTQVQTQPSDKTHLSGRGLIVRAFSRIVMALPPVKGVGLMLEYGSRIFSRWNFEVVTRVHGSMIYGNPSITDGRRLLFTSRYHDVAERAFVRRILGPGDYAVDLGANIGLYTLLFCKIVASNGSVTAIEAEPTNAAKLRRNLELNAYANATVVEKGASDKFETLQLHLSGTNLGMHSFLKDEGKGDLSIACEPLAGLLQNRKPRLIKIDVEGFEFRVLRRYFADVLADQRPDFIMLEDWPSLREGDPVKLCCANGYRVIDRAGPNVMLEQI